MCPLLENKKQLNWIRYFDSLFDLAPAWHYRPPPISASWATWIHVGS
jgi:hypothetical protein